MVVLQVLYFQCQIQLQTVRIQCIILFLVNSLANGPGTLSGEYKYIMYNGIAQHFLHRCQPSIQSMDSQVSEPTRL